jgi:hypothetical protein
MAVPPLRYLVVARSLTLSSRPNVISVHNTALPP